MSERIGICNEAKRIQVTGQNDVTVKCGADVTLQKRIVSTCSGCGREQGMGHEVGTSCVPSWTDERSIYTKEQRDAYVCGAGHFMAFLDADTSTREDRSDWNVAPPSRKGQVLLISQDSGQQVGPRARTE